MAFNKNKSCIFASKFARLTKCVVPTTQKSLDADKGIVSRSTRFNAFRGLATYGNYAPFGITQNAFLFNARPEQL
jgi:hypothetical protein